MEWSVKTPYLTKDKSPVSEGKEHHVTNEDEIGESHELQLKSEYEIYLLNYTINIKNLNWAFEVLFFKKNLKTRFSKPNSTALVLRCSGISLTICKQSAPCSRQITTPIPHHSVFTGRMLFLMPKQQCQSTEGRIIIS